MLIEAIIRRFDQYRTGATPPSVRQTYLESLAVGQVEPPDFEMTRAGLRFDIGFLAVTGIAPVQAIPTTAAQWLIYNPGPKAIAFSEIGVVLVSGTAGAGIVVLGAIVGTGVRPATPPIAHSANIFTASRSTGGSQPTKNSAVIVAASQTLAASPPRGWRVLAESVSAATAILSVAAINRNLGGGLICPAGEGLALAVTSPTGTSPLYAPHAVWCELDTDLE